METNPVTKSYLKNNSSFSTAAIHAGSEPQRWKDASIMPHICLSTIFLQDVPPGNKGLDYSRCGSSTRDCLEACLAKLEEAAFCLVYPSGMAAVSSMTKILEKGDHVIVHTDTFHGSHTLFKRIHAGTDEIDVAFLDCSDETKVRKAIRPNTKLVWLESPSNPVMKLIDLKSVTSLIKTGNPKTIVACDNTFMSPYFQRPSTLGVDVVMHSVTKYIAGHSDVLMGALCMNDENLYQKLRRDQIVCGSVPSSFDCYLVVRSLKTLEVRMQRHMQNGLRVAECLESHPMVEKVLHPGLPSHPQHQLSLRQCYGHSGMFSFYVKGHQLDKTQKVLKNLKFIQIADSLGGIGTTVKMPSRMPAVSVSASEMASQGITDGLLRLSTGIENVQDIIQDLNAALNSINV